MGEVGDRRPAVEVFETEESGLPNWLFAGACALGTGGFGLLLLLKWDDLVDGHYSRRRGGLERILDELGQGTAVAVLFSLAALSLLWAVLALRKEHAEWRAEEEKAEEEKAEQEKAEQEKEGA